MDGMSTGLGQPNLNRTVLAMFRVSPSGLGAARHRHLSRPGDGPDRRVGGEEAAAPRVLEEKRTALISHAVTKGLDPNVPMKDAGIGRTGSIPEHWTVHQLRRVVDRFIDYRGRTPTKTDSGVPLITAGAVRDGLIEHSQAPEFMPEEDYDDWMCRGLPELGDVVVTTEAPLGRGCAGQGYSRRFCPANNPVQGQSQENGTRVSTLLLSCFSW